jgi:hypothetical protein
VNSSPKRSSGSSEKSRRKAGTLDLSTARQMLPLVRSIVADIVDSKKTLLDLSSEQDQLDRNRRQLEWAARDRRYSLRDEVAKAEQNYGKALTELDELGVSLVDLTNGRVDFPTRINGRSAAFSWQLGEEGVAHWRYSEEEQLRPIPSDWEPGAAVRSRANS